MFMESKDGKSCGLYCSCGCEEGVILKVENDEDFGCNISLVNDIYLTSQLNIWDRFKEKCKRIWKIIINKEYRYFDMYIDNEDINEFKEFISNI